MAKKSHRGYDATAVFLDVGDDGSAVLSLLTVQPVDLTILLPPVVLEQLRLQIASLTKQAISPFGPPPKA